VFFASRVDNPQLTTQVRPPLDRRPDRSRNLIRVLDPRRINDHVVRWEPNVGISKVVIDPIAVVVDVGLRQLHAGKRYTRGRLSQLLTRLHFLHLHSSGGNGGNLAVVHFGIEEIEALLEGENSEDRDSLFTKSRPRVCDVT